jgi:hypothetical protein
MATSDQKRLALARAVWVVGVALVVGLTLALIPVQIAYNEMVCSGPACAADQLSPADLAQLQQAGLSLSFYAVYQVVTNTAFVLLFVGVGAVIIWRRSDDWFAIFTATSLALMGFSFTFGGPPPAILERSSPLVILVEILVVAGDVALPTFFYLFPDGRFVPRWTRWVVPVLVVVEAIAAFRPGGLGVAYNVYSILVTLILIVVVIYRYTRVSTIVQRQQTKYVVFGSCLAAIGVAGLNVFSGVAYPGNNPPAGVALLVNNTAWQLCLVLIPLSIAMAILRSRLWDIDLIIRRTLVYAALTALLAAVYFGSVVVLQSIFSAVTGQQRSELVTVLSTLAIAALFVPLRARVQRIIDQRFYRGKYDAARTMAEFGASLRDEVDMDTLTERLQVVVDKTMQPKSVGLWLTKPKK